MTNIQYEVIWSVTTKHRFNFNTREEAVAFRTALVRNGRAGLTYTLRNVEDIEEMEYGSEDDEEY